MSLKAADSLSNGFENSLESHLRSPEENLEEAPPIPGIRYVMGGSLDIIISKVYLFVRNERCYLSFFRYKMQLTIMQITHTIALAISSTGISGFIFSIP